MTDFITQFVTVRPKSEYSTSIGKLLHVRAVRDSFVQTGFSIRPYFLDSGTESLTRFYIDYTSAGLLTVWMIRYGMLYNDVLFTPVVLD